MKWRLRKKDGAGKKIRLQKCIAQADFADVSLRQLNASHIARWRDRRLQAVSPSTVNRELNILQALFKVAKDEWLWIEETPFKGVKRPKNPAPRSRRISAREIELMCCMLKLNENCKITLKKQEVALAFLLAIETAMRAGEMLALTWADVRDKSVHLRNTKNGDQREVPLSRRARELLARMSHVHNERVFSIRAATLDLLFRRARTLATTFYPEISTLHFHDTRHEACTRLANKISVLELARIIGHRDLKSLMIYYNPTTDELADKLG